MTLPFVVVIVNARLMRLDRSIEEAARDLGATAFQSFRLVVFPLVAPALLGAVLIVVAWSFDELVITFFTSGGDADPSRPHLGHAAPRHRPFGQRHGQRHSGDHDRLHAVGRTVH